MLTKWDRRVIPRWRDSSVSLVIPTNNSFFAEKTSHQRTSFNQIDVVHLLNEWHKEKSIGGAADILNFAHIPDVLPLLREPAEYLISANESVSPFLKRVATNILEREVFSDIDPRLAPDLDSYSNEWKRREISRLKKNIFIGYVTINY